MSQLVGRLIPVNIAHTNTSTSPTISFNGLTPVAITNPNGSAISVDQLAIGGAVVMYDGTNAELMSVSDLSGYATLGDLGPYALISDLASYTQISQTFATIASLAAETSRAEAAEASRVPLANMATYNTAYNGGGSSSSASASFTAGFDGIVIVNGNAGQGSGSFTSLSFTVSGEVSGSLFSIVNFATATTTVNCLGIVNAVFRVTTGEAINMTFAMTGTGSSTSGLSFIFNVIPTA